MAEILFIKTSSLGDVVHHMPAVSESRAHFPEARISWLVEEAYAPLVRLHPAVDEVVPVASRRWRHSLHSSATWREIGAWRRGLTSRRYNQIIDTQGLIRTALMSRASNGTRHGYDRASIREPLASYFYDVRHQVPRDAHAITRNRDLTGLALGYRSQGATDYGLDRARLRTPGERYAILLHASARAEKEWPVSNWIALGAALAQRGVALVVPWGNDKEHARAAKIADAVPKAQIAEQLSIDGMARLIAGAEFVIGGDTGLLHLAAAFGVPLVAIFSASNPDLTRPVGAGPIAVVSTKGIVPSVEQVSSALAGILS